MKRMAGILLGVLLVLGACSSSGGSKALSKDDFLKQGNDICKKGNDAIDAGVKQAFPDQTQQPDPEKLKQLFNSTILPNIKKQVDDIAALKPPSDLKSAVDKLVKDVRSKLAEVQDQVNKDPASFFNASQDPFTDVNKEANDIGLTTCGQSGGAPGS